MTILKDHWSVSSQLERYAIECCAVVLDDGTVGGMPTGKQGELARLTPIPAFEPWLLEVEWKFIPAELLDQILNLPAKTKHAEACVASAFEYADPPEYEEAFEERQFRFAALGIEAGEIASKLRRYVKSSPVLTPRWNQQRRPKRRLL